MASPCPPRRTDTRRATNLGSTARTPLSRMAGVDLPTIEGIAEGPALVLLSAIGTAMTRWPSVQHCWSWLGLCPQHKISGGNVLAWRVRPGAHRVPVALRRAARSVPHSQSAVGAFFRRMKARLGPPQGHHGHGAQAGSPGLERVETGDGLRPAGHGSLRNPLPGTDSKGDGPSSQNPRLCPRPAGRAGLNVLPAVSATAGDDHTTRPRRDDSPPLGERGM
jgi:hypothetical protein